MKKLYVGNLPYTTTDTDLKDMFSQAGEVTSAVIIMDKMSHTPRSKGFGFVEMTNDNEADAAIDMFNGKDMGGRALTVNVARPMEPRENRGGDRGGDRGGYRAR
ncbi:MAG TPA: RNA-binding protein [Candidatus Paceibacterota bacterium]